MSVQTQKKVTRLNADALSQIFDRVTVQALLNMVRITGGDVDGVTVPELSGQSDETKALVEVVRQQVILLQVVADYIQAAPFPIPSTPAEDVTQLQSEVRQIGEQVATLMQVVQLELRPGFDSLTQFSNQIIAETRHLADQQIVNANLIQELKQGTML